jgi:hypothetical protein
MVSTGRREREREREELPPLLVERKRAMYQLLLNGSSSGQQPWARLYAEGHGDTEEKQQPTLKNLTPDDMHSSTNRNADRNAVVSRTQFVARFPENNSSTQDRDFPPSKTTK